MQVFGKEDIVRSAHRSDRPRAGAAAARQAGPLLPRGRAAPTRLVIELPKGGYAPVFKQRDTPVLVKRSVAAALVSRNTVAVLPFADHSVGPRPRLLLPRRPRRDRPSPRAIRRRCGSSRRTSRASTGDKTDAAMIISGSVRAAGERLRVTAQLVDGATGCYSGPSRSTRRSADLFAAQERVAEAIVARIEPELGDGRAELGVAPAEREPGRAQPLSAGPLSPEPAHRGRAAQGARLLREGAGRRRASTRRRTAGWPTPTACWRTTACSGRPRSGRRRRRARRRR